LKPKNAKRLVELAFIVTRRAMPGVTLEDSLPKETHDDRFWALALVVYAAEQAQPSASRPIVRTI